MQWHIDFLVPFFSQPLKRVQMEFMYPFGSYDKMVGSNIRWFSRHSQPLSGIFPQIVGNSNFYVAIPPWS